jgi:hypothetical protein
LTDMALPSMCPICAGEMPVLSKLNLTCIFGQGV